MWEINTAVGWGRGFMKHSEPVCQLSVKHWNVCSFCSISKQKGVCVCVVSLCVFACMRACAYISIPPNCYALCLIVRYMQVLPRTVRVATVGNTVCMLLLFLVTLHVWPLCVYMCMEYPGWLLYLHCSHLYSWCDSKQHTVLVNQKINTHGLL